MSESTMEKRFRSPPFPTMPLQKAIERAEQLYRQERDHLAPLASAARAWGMSPTSSGPIVTTGALRQYGLVEDEGAGPARKIRLTHDALRIILDKIPTSPSRLEAIQRAFFAPKVFSELWQNWRAELPSDQTIINHLVLERRLKGQAPFSETAAAELLANYRASLSFAAPGDVLNVPSPNDESGGITTITECSVEPIHPTAESLTAPRPTERPVMSRSRDEQGRMRLMEQERELITGPLSKESNFRLIVSGKIGAKELSRLIRKLELEREILTDNDEDEAEQESQP